MDENVSLMKNLVLRSLKTPQAPQMKHNGENSVRRKFRTAKLPYGENSVRQNSVRRKVLTAKAPYGKNSILRKIHTAKNPTEKIPTAKNPTAKIPATVISIMFGCIGSKLLCLVKGMSCFKRVELVKQLENS